MRDITGLTSLLSASEIEPFLAVDLMFDNSSVIFNGETVTVSPLYLWTGIGEIEIDGNTYTGAGSLLSISAISETSDISAQTRTQLNNQFILFYFNEDYKTQRTTDPVEN